MIIKAASITSLYTAFSAAFTKGYSAAPSRWKDVSIPVPSATKMETYGWLAALPRMRDGSGERVVNNLSVRGYAIVNRKFESTVSVGRTEIEDDQFGIYSPLMQQMGAEAAMLRWTPETGQVAKRVSRL